MNLNNNNTEIASNNIEYKMMKYKVPVISPFGVKCVLLFLLLSLIGRFIFPHSDEPDFSVRAPEIVFSKDFPVWLPYSVLHDLTSEFYIREDCIVSASPLSLWASIDKVSCTEDTMQSLTRFVITAAVAAPLLFILIFRRFSFRFISLFRERSNEHDFDLHLDAVGLSLLFPSVIYYSGLLSVEQATLLWSFLLFPLWNRLILTVLLLILLSSIDFGNTVVLGCFLIIFYLSSMCRSRYGFKITILSLLFLLIFSYVAGFSVLHYMPVFDERISQKSDAILSGFENNDLSNKYAVILRPVITFMTMIYATPSNIKVPLVYCIVIAAILLTIKRIHKNYRAGILSAQNIESIQSALVCLVIIVMFIFILPTYANAKYYLFALPFFITPALNLYSRETILRFFMLITSLVYINIILYYN